MLHTGFRSSGTSRMCGIGELRLWEDPPPSGARRVRPPRAVRTAATTGTATSRSSNAWCADRLLDHFRHVKNQKILAKMQALYDSFD